MLFFGDVVFMSDHLRSRLRRILQRFALAGLVFGLCGSAIVEAATPPRVTVGRLRVELDRIVAQPTPPELRTPLFVTAPDDNSGRLFFLEKGILFSPIPETPPLGYDARIRLLENGTLSTFLDLSAEVHPQSESGLL